MVTTIAGGELRDFSGDGGPAIEAGLRYSSFMTIGPDGSIYITASSFHRIRKVTPDGQIDTIAGTGPSGNNAGQSTGDGGPASEARLNRPGDIAVAPDGTIYFVESGTRIRRISPDGIIDTYLTSDINNPSPDGTPRSEAQAGRAARIEVDDAGRLHWLDGSAVRRISLDDTIETVWGEVTQPFVGSIGRFSLSGDGIAYLANNDQVFRLAPEGEQVLVAGVDRATASRGDGGPALDAFLVPPFKLDVGPNDEIYIADETFNRLRVIRDGRIEALVGTVQMQDLIAEHPDSGPFNWVRDIVAGPDGTVFFATGQVVFRRDAGTGAIERYAGGGFGMCPEPCTFDRAALDAKFYDIEDIDVDNEGIVYVRHDPNGNISPGERVSRISTHGTIRRLSEEISGDHSTGDARAISVDLQGDLVLADRYRSLRFWKVDAEENFTPYEGAAGFFETAAAVTSDGSGSLYVASRPNHLQRLTADGLINSIVPLSPNGPEISGDGGPAGEAVVSGISSMELDSKGNLYFTDWRRVRRINSVAECPVFARPQIAAYGLKHATGVSGGLVAPGTIVSVYGIRLGPEVGVGGRVENGRFTTELAGTRIWVNGRPAPIIYSSATQVNAIIPYATEIGAEYDENGRFLRRTGYPLFRLEYDGVSSDPASVPMAPLAPGLFRMPSGLVAALNQDGTLNSPINPAPLGSIITVFGSGEGHTDPPGVDGQLAGDVLPRPLADVEVTIHGQPAEVLYFGAAPGLVAGVFQLNVRIPVDLAAVGPLEIAVRVGPFPRYLINPPEIIVGQ